MAFGKLAKNNRGWQKDPGIERGDPPNSGVGARQMPNEDPVLGKASGT